MDVTHNNLPTAIAELIKGQKEMREFLYSSEKSTQTEIETPIQDGINGVSRLIGKTVPTIYGYCQRNEIPHAKQGNRLIFFKSEIINWLKEGKQKTTKEIEAEAEAFLSNAKIGLK